MNKLVIYKQIVEILRPGESVLKAVRRLGGVKAKTASDRWRKEKKKQKDEEENDEAMKVSKCNSIRLTDSYIVYI